MPNSTPLLLNLCINDADVNRLPGGTMVERGIHFSAKPPAAPADQPAVSKLAAARFPKWVLQLAHKINLKLCKVAPEVHPFLKTLSRNRIDPHEVMRELGNCGHQLRKLDLNDLNNLNDFELYRLYKTLKSNDAIFEVLKYFVDQISEMGPGNDREQDFLFTLTMMHTNISQLWTELCTVLENRGISVNPNRNPADEDTSKALKYAVNKNYDLVLADDYVLLEDHFKKTGEIDQKMLLALLKDVYKRIVADDRDGTIEATSLCFMQAGTRARHEFLSAALPVVRDLRHQDPRSSFLEAQKLLFADGGGRDMLRVGHLEEIDHPANAVCALHDIARYFSSLTDPTELKAAVRSELKICGLDKAVASAFMDIADHCLVTGRSAIVREAIGEYAAEPTRPRPKTWPHWSAPDDV